MPSAKYCCVPSRERWKVWAADASWSPDGRSFVGYVQESLLTQKDEIVRVTFE
jgi:hypothetical protein